jgi:hypothetical protein
LFDLFDLETCHCIQVQVVLPQCFKPDDRSFWETCSSVWNETEVLEVRANLKLQVERSLCENKEVWKLKEENRTKTQNASPFTFQSLIWIKVLTTLPHVIPILFVVNFFHLCWLCYGFDSLPPSQVHMLYNVPVVLSFLFCSRKSP